MATNIITRSDAEALIPTETAAEIITGVRQQSAALSLMRKLPNMATKQRKLPVLSGLAVAGFVSGDTGLKSVSAEKWANKYITAEEIAVIVPIAEAVLDDADYDIWTEIKPDIMEAFGAVIDGAVMFGVDKPDTWPTGLVPGAIAAGNTVPFGSGRDVAADINDAMALVEASGYDVTGYAADNTLKAALRGLRDQNGGLIYQPTLQAETPSTLYAQPIHYVRNGSWVGTTAKLLAGDWSQAVYAIRQDITYKVLDQAVISDASGKILYNLAQQDMIALRCVMRLGWQLPNPVNRLQPDEANRYPFAVITPASSPEPDAGENNMGA